MSTPAITLTIDLKDLNGAEVGSAASPAYVRIALCGYGAQLPRVPGTALLGEAVTWPNNDEAYTGAPLSVELWGNDQITPAGTFYSISILDSARNVIQAGAYRFTGTSTIDLSSAVPLPPAGATRLAGVAPNGIFPGSGYMLPSAAVAGLADAVCYYNGQLQLPGESMGDVLNDYVVNGRGLQMSFETEAGDSLWVQYATCDNASAGPQLTPWLCVANGVTPGVAFTVPTPPVNAQLVGVFLNGLFQPPSLYTLASGNLTFTNPTGDDDLVQLLYFVGTSPVLTGGAPTGAVPGTTYTLTGTLVAGLWKNGLFQRPGIDYTVSGSTITLRTATVAGDTLYAI